MTKAHSFHIPVMGIGFTIDTPLKVSQYGIDSVISIVDDILLEKLRKAYCTKHHIPYEEISTKLEDFRAKRVTSYLNLINNLAEKKFESLKNTIYNKGSELKEYFAVFPESSSLKNEFRKLTEKCPDLHEIGSWIKDNLRMGSIDVNIMTKVDRSNYKNGEKLPIEFNDAHAALRGFANSTLHSSVVLSAGMNPRLYGYIEQFKDFYPDEKGEIKKKITLKVSDYRSALIQGKFLAKKGLWVSEYRIESGLNCGGHAFATEGFLLGPILAEFRDQKDSLIQSTWEILTKALSSKDMIIPNEVLPIKLSAQGGVGTAEEHQFLLDHYKVDSVGWGTPFLLVPEATKVDEPTLKKLISAKEEDLYLSNISPLGVPFHNLKGNTKDQEKLTFVMKGKSGSPCPKKFLALNNEFTEESICSASRQYQKLKIQELDKENLPSEEFEKKFEKIVDKSCICVGLGTSALLVDGVDTKTEGTGVSICPGPNLAYFSKKISLTEMIDHIYGRANMISRTDRPNMFVKELKIYLEYISNEIDEVGNSLSVKKEKYLLGFIANLQDGIQYYQGLFSDLKNKLSKVKTVALQDLDEGLFILNKLNLKVNKIAKT